jgi:hypothetical protein
MLPAYGARRLGAAANRRMAALDRRMPATGRPMPGVKRIGICHHYLDERVEGGYDGLRRKRARNRLTVKGNRIA